MFWLRFKQTKCRKFRAGAVSYSPVTWGGVAADTCQPPLQSRCQNVLRQPLISRAGRPAANGGSSLCPGFLPFCSSSAAGLASKRKGSARQQRSRWRPGDVAAKAVAAPLRGSSSWGRRLHFCQANHQAFNSPLLESNIFTAGLQK